MTARRVATLQEWYNEHWGKAEDISAELLRVTERHPSAAAPKLPSTVTQSPEAGITPHSETNSSTLPPFCVTLTATPT